MGLEKFQEKAKKAIESASDEGQEKKIYEKRQQAF